MEAGRVIQSWQAVASAKAASKPRPALVAGQWLTATQGQLPPRPTGTLGQDLWMQLDPLFPTSRSALGIHNCYPGVGCICIPDRQRSTALPMLCVATTSIGSLL